MLTIDAWLWLRSQTKKLDLRAEILDSLNAIENIWLRKWLEARLKANSKP